MEMIVYAHCWAAEENVIISEYKHPYLKEYA